MIKSANINNFQSHEKSTFEFSKGVNIIVGNTDSGKSAIIRALRWIIRNKPSGNAIRSNWGGKTFVRLEDEEGNYLIRSKDKQDLYILRIIREKRIVFKAFGTSVPEEINSFLNFNEINIQNQLDAPFLFSKSAGEAAIHFNKIARLDKINSSQVLVKKIITTLTHDIAYTREQIKENKVKLKQFDFLDKFEIDLEVLEEQDKQLRIKKNSIISLSNLCEDYKKIKTSIKSESNILNIEDDVDRILELIEKRKGRKNKIEKITVLITTIEEKEEEHNELIQKIKTENNVIKILQLYKERKTLKQHKISLSNEVTNLSQVTTTLKKEKTHVIALKKKFEKIFPQRCPLCGLPVPHDKK